MSQWELNDDSAFYIAKLETEQRRLRWTLSVVLNPNGENTMLDEYNSMDEDFWERMGI